MPTNLPPDYFDAEKRYRRAETVAEKIECLEEMLSIMPKHKGTDKLRAGLRKRLSKLRSSPQAKSTGKRESAYYIDREGAGQVVVVGPANVGKSALVAALTNATPEVADFPFTTWQPTPGMLEIEDIQVQLIDTPPLNPDYVEPELIQLIRRADLILLMLNLQTDPLQQLEETAALLEEGKILPRHRQADYAEQRGLSFKRFLVVVNKYDDEEAEEYFEIFRELLEGDWLVLPISVTGERNLDQLKQVIFEQLGIIRVYSKAPGRDPDYGTPFVLKKGCTVHEFAGKVHKDFLEKLSAARIWGTGVYEGQLVGRDHCLHDGDVVELHD
ncbi:MAG: 50S ribosome-binding GTPase [Chloroflexia bacterium]|nr:50S ribosome-binding GTPase [Chloroflexia bacterium]